MKKYTYFLLAILTLSCEKDIENPTIVSVSPQSGGYNTLVTIELKSLNIAATTCVVKFNGKEVPIKAATSNQLQVDLPKGSTSGPVTVSFNNTTLIGPAFEYVLTPTVTTIAGNGNKNNKDGPALSAEFNAPTVIDTDSKGNIFVVSNGEIRMISSDGVTSTISTPGTGISGMCIGKNDVIYASSGMYIFKVNGNNNYSAIVTAGFLVDGAYPSFDQIAMGPDGLIYALDPFSNRIFSCSTGGVIKLLAGKPQEGYLDGDAKSALFRQLGNLLLIQEEICTSPILTIPVSAK